MAYQKPQFIAIGEAAKLFGVSVGTLRIWESKGLIKCSRTFGLHRRYELKHLKHLIDLEEQMTDFKPDWDFYWAIINGAEAYTNSTSSHDGMEFEKTIREYKDLVGDNGKKIILSVLSSRDCTERQAKAIAIECAKIKAAVDAR